ncbi:hypothetical protein LSTR_LSTR004886 [Laodelphax striatellus]|uniref:lysozyme n=1 Tax=Laodelphax striatellus TaxID=195883 RepID=A0A482XN59_LAOST|nr:hypothetical protein LSTR_LSTR004886 [Laodelphax striatellus]
MHKLLLLIIAAFCSSLITDRGFIIEVHGGFIIEPITDKCLTCICNGASRCGLGVKCDGDVCGVFSIGYEYWLDSNSPTLPFDDPESEGAYIRCASDLYCGAEVVANYMKKNPYDCNSDGSVTCWDYAGLHNRGRLECAGFWDIDFEMNYKSCMNNSSMIINFGIA